MIKSISHFTLWIILIPALVAALLGGVGFLATGVMFWAFQTPAIILCNIFYILGNIENEN